MIFFPPNVLYSKISLLRSLPAEFCRSLDRLHLPTVLLLVCWFISAQKTEKLFLSWVWKAGLAALRFLFRSLLLLSLKCLLPSPLLWLQPCRLATGLLWDERTRGFCVSVRSLRSSRLSNRTTLLRPAWMGEVTRSQRPAPLDDFAEHSCAFEKVLSEEICGHSRKNEVEWYKRLCWNLVKIETSP